MHQSKTLQDTLNSLAVQGYAISDQKIEDIPDETYHSDDWKVDMVKQIGSEKEYKSTKSTLVIAVSSASKSLKIVFVQVVKSASEFSPKTLLRKLFPRQ